MNAFSEPPDLEGLDRQYAEEAGATKPNGSDASPPPALVTAKAFVSGYKAPEYLVDGVIQRGRLYSETALTGHGKTSVSLAINAHLNTGLSLAGRRVERSKTVYFAAENPDDTKARVILMANRMRLDLDSLPLWFVEGGFDLNNWTDHIRKQVESIGGADMITVDTGPAFLAACGFGDENDNIQSLRYALKLRELTKLPGNPTVLVPTHPIKNAAKDNLLPRGGGAFLNEMDGNLTLWAEGDRLTTELSWQGKIRGPNFDPITFALEPGTCPELVDPVGRMIPSVWSYQIDQERAEQVARRQREAEDAVLVAMANFPKGSFASWARDLGWFLPNGEPAKYLVQRAVGRLKDDKLATKTRDRWHLTGSGKAEAERLEKRMKGEAE